MSSLYGPAPQMAPDPFGLAGMPDFSQSQAPGGAVGLTNGLGATAGAAAPTGFQPTPTPLGMPPSVLSGPAAGDMFGMQQGQIPQGLPQAGQSGFGPAFSSASPKNASAPRFGDCGIISIPLACCCGIPIIGGIFLFLKSLFKRN